MGNTLMYKDPQAHTFTYYRIRDDKVGSLFFTSNSIESLVKDMKRCRDFKEPFKLEAGVPKNASYNPNYLVKLKPLSKEEIKKARELLKAA